MKSTTYMREPIKLSVSKKFVDESERKLLDKIGLGRIVSYSIVRFYKTFDTQIYATLLLGSWAIYIYFKV